MITKKMFLAATAIVALAGCKQTTTVKPEPTGKEAKWDAVVQDSYPSWQAPKKTAVKSNDSVVSVKPVPAEPVIKVVEKEPIAVVKTEPKQINTAPTKTKPVAIPPKKVETVDPNAGLREQLEQSENGVYYTIKLNDSFWKLSKSFYGTGMKWQTISEANKGNYKSPTKLVIGKKLFIPKLPQTK